VQPISAAVLDQQQKVADAFTSLKLIPKTIVVKDAQPAVKLAAK